MGSIIVIFLLIGLTQAVPTSQTTYNSKDSKQTYNQNDQTMAATQIHDQDNKDSQYASSSILENPSYDPNLFSSFIPQDAIQQYVNQFGGPYAPYTPGVFPPPAPFAVQTGYEGYLVPEIQSIAEPIYSGPLTFLRGIVPKFLVAWMIKSATVLISTLGLILFGGAITTAVCTLTPLCSISFSALPATLKWQQTAEAVGKAVGSEITPERIRRTAKFVRAAIDKFTELQHTDDESGAHKATDKNN